MEALIRVFRHFRSRVGEVVTEPLPPQNRACASNALGSSHGRFALALRFGYPWLFRVRGVRNSSFRPVSLPWPCSCDAPLPSVGSRRSRFPALISTMRALRLPALLPFGLLIHQPVPRFACCFAPGPPQAGAGPDPLFWPVVRVPAFVRGQIRGLPGSPASHPVAMRTFSDPGRPASASPVTALPVLPPQL